MDFGHLLLGLLALWLGGRAHSERQRRRKQATRHQEAREDLNALLKGKEAEVASIRQRLIDIFPRPFLSLDGKGKIVRVNHAARALVNNRPLIGRSLSSIFLSKELHEGLEKNPETTELSTFSATFHPGEVVSAFAGNQESHWKVDVLKTSLNGDPSEVQLMMLDVSRFVYTEQVRRDFVANASHELRTPLSIISGYLEILHEEDPENGYINTMLAHLGRINRIIDDMLLIARLESEKEAPLDREPFALRECVSKVVERLSPLIEKQNDQVQVLIPEDLTLAGDHFYWTQVFYNLIENALKQNAENQITISIEARKQEEGTIEIQVRDDGKGIPPNSLPFIFNRFYRVEKHHSQNKVRGTGLGLSIVKRAVEAHQGRISATSRPGIDTTFTILLPPQDAVEGK